MSNFKKGVFSSLLLVSESILNKLIGLVSTLVLARVLLPEDFGIVAIATLTVGFFEILSNTGSVQYLLRVEKISNSEVNTSWTINILLRFVLSLAIVSASFFASDYYEDPRIQELMLVLSVIYFIEAWQNPGIVYLKRNQEYAGIVKITLVGKVFAVFSAVSIALYFESYWALIVGQAISKLSTLAGYYIIYPYVPKFELTNAKRQWTFSGWMIPQSILGFFRTQLDTFLAASIFGKAELGSFHTMKYLAFIPTAYLLLPMTETLLVEMRKASIEFENFKKLFNAAFFIALLIAAPISTFIYYFHEVTTLVLLGGNWVEYSQLLACFSLLITSAVFHEHCSKTLIIFNKPKHLFVYEIITFIIVYSILLTIGLSDLVVFTYTRVGLEQLFSLCFLIYTSLRYTDVKNLLKLMLGTFIILMACVGAAFIVPFLVSVSNTPIAHFVLTAITFFTLFYTIFILCYFVFLRGFSEWQYIYLLTLRIVNPIKIKFVRD
jgi:lipopolysaccharide exporter